MSLSPEWIAIGTLAVLSLGLLVVSLTQSRRIAQISASQRALLQQSEAVHRAQMAYSEATEEAMSHLRDGLQTLTTVSANLDMKTYALEIQQSRTGQWVKQQESRRQKTAELPAVAVRQTPPPTTPVVNKPTLGKAPYSAAERELMAAVSGRPARVA